MTKKKRVVYPKERPIALSRNPGICALYTL